MSLKPELDYPLSRTRAVAASSVKEQMRWSPDALRSLGKVAVIAVRRVAGSAARSASKEGRVTVLREHVTSAAMDHGADDGPTVDAYEELRAHNARLE